MVHFLTYVISGFCNIIILMIVIQAIMSWFVPMFSDSLRRVYNGIDMVTDPFIRPFRKLMQRFTYSIGIDFSPLIAIIAIQMINRLIVILIYAFFR